MWERAANKALVVLVGIVVAGMINSGMLIKWGSDQFVAFLDECAAWFDSH